MSFILMLFWAIAMVLLARFICKTWINHLSLYTLVWTISLGAYELRWIRYNSITDEAWLYIFIAWISLYLGSAAAMGSHDTSPHVPETISLPKLKLGIVLLSCGGLISSIALAIEIMRDVDPNLFVAVTVYATKIYEAAFEETGQFSGIPYLGFLPFAAAALAGVYTAKRARIDWVSLIPVIAGTILGVLSVSRFDMLFCGALFIIALYLSPKPTRLSLSSTQKVLLASVCLSGIVLVSLARTDLVSALPDEQSALAKIGNFVSVAPSLYFYISGPPVGFSEYLQNSTHEASLPWGRYTFASIYRVLSKIGLTPYVPFHQEFYGTPEPVNTCTYLREIHSDFGIAGVFLVPGLLGYIATRLSNKRQSLVALTGLTYLYVVILFSFTNLVAATGQWFQGLLTSLAAAFVLEYLSRRRSIPTKYLTHSCSQAGI